MRLVISIIVMFLASVEMAASERIILQSTTSTQNSGLLDAILPIFTEETGIEVSVVAVGTGQALKNAENGDGDVLLVHARALEDAFVEQGWGVARHDLMYNDFVIVGPSDDPAGLASLDQEGASAAMQRIAESEAIFVSRGDSSGTHIKELQLWAPADIDPVQSSGTWYRETGSGMGTTLNIAVEMDGYTLTDRGSWISFGNKRDHVILLEGDPVLFNPYGLILVNPERHPHVAAKAGQTLIDWMTGEAGQDAIAGYKLNGEQLFFPAVD